MAHLTVDHVSGDAFRVGVRGHTLVTDQPGRPGDSGEELGPSPVELLAASLATCAGFYARRYLRRVGLTGDGVRVECRWTLRAGKPSRISRFQLTLLLPDELPAEHHEGVRTAVEECAVHATLLHPPEIHLDLVAGSDRADATPGGPPVTPTERESA